MPESLYRHRSLLSLLNCWTYARSPFYTVTSLDWLRCLRSHLVALDHEDEASGQRVNFRAIFNRIVRLRVGEALLFAPSAIVRVMNEGNGKASSGNIQVKKLVLNYMRIKIWARVTVVRRTSVFAKWAKGLRFVKFKIPMPTGRVNLKLGWGFYCIEAGVISMYFRFWV